MRIISSLEIMDWMELTTRNSSLSRTRSTFQVLLITDLKVLNITNTRETNQEKEENLQVNCITSCAAKLPVEIREEERQKRYRNREEKKRMKKNEVAAVGILQKRKRRRRRKNRKQ